MSTMIARYKAEVDKLYAKKDATGLVAYRKYVDIFKTGDTRMQVQKLLSAKSINRIKKNYVKTGTKESKEVLIAKILSALTKRELNELYEYINSKLV